MHPRAARFVGTAAVPVLFQCCHCDGELLEALISHPKLVNPLESREGVGIKCISLPSFVWGESRQQMKCSAEEERGAGGVCM